LPAELELMFVLTQMMVFEWACTMHDLRAYDPPQLYSQEEDDYERI